MIAAALAHDVPAPDVHDTRRCIATGAVLSRDGLVRFVIGPNREVYPDINEKLPGRGLWLACSQAAFTTAIRKNLFAKAAKEQVLCPPDLIERTIRLMREQTLRLLGLARSSGLVFAGFPQIELALKKKDIALLLLEIKASGDGVVKLRQTDKKIPIIQIFDGEELGRALGRDHITYIGLRPHSLTRKIEIAGQKFSTLSSQEKIAPEASLAQITGNFTDSRES